MMPALEVAAPGLLATVQDLGRGGYQQRGVPVSGGMDLYALQIANLLVGNPRGAAVVEFALRGPLLKALDDRVVAVCGADFGANVGGQPRPAWKSFLLRSGEVLEFARPARGVWGYLAVAGGIDVPPLMGSRSTYLRGKFGGYLGRALAAGDVLNAGEIPGAAREGRALAPSQIPQYGRAAVARIVLGPQQAAFVPAAMDALLSAEYEVSGQSDRMGYRLKGPPLRHVDKADILSEAVAAGTVQVPADGQPIVLLADRQPTGGYAKIATVISVDIVRVAQLPPGGRLQFKAVDVPTAQAAACGLEALLETLRRGCGVP